MNVSRRSIGYVVLAITKESKRKKSYRSTSPAPLKAGALPDVRVSEGARNLQSRR